MKTRLIALAAGLLALPAMADAAFVGAQFRLNEQATLDARALGGALADAQVYELYLVFDNAGNKVLNIFNSDVATNQGSLLYQDGFGGNFAPQSSFFGLVPTLPYDSFVTLNLLADNTSVSADPDFAFSANGFVGGWFNSNPPNNLGLAALNGDSGLYETLAARMTLQSVETSGAWTGDFGLTWNDATGATQQLGSVIGFNNLGDIDPYPVPTPGAMTLLALAGLTAARRRR